MPGRAEYLNEKACGKSDVADEFERRLEIGIAFAGKADDEVGGKREIGARLAHPGDEVEIVADPMATVHLSSRMRSEPDCTGRCR